MREFSEQLIKDIAVQCGLDAALVMRKAAKPSEIDKKKRIEMEFMPENYTYSPGKIAKGINDAKTHRRIRTRKYKAKFVTRAVVFSDDEDWLAQFVKNFIVRMPVKIADTENNLVKIRVEKATRGGFKRKMVETSIKRSSSLHITFEWMLCTDQETPLIRDVNIVNGITINR